jgi:hypothetical protein
MNPSHLEMLEQLASAERVLAGIDLIFATGRMLDPQLIQLRREHGPAYAPEIAQAMIADQLFANRAITDAVNSPLGFHVWPDESATITLRLRKPHDGAPAAQVAAFKAQIAQHIGTLRDLITAYERETLPILEAKGREVRDPGIGEVIVWEDVWEDSL